MPLVLLTVFILGVVTIDAFEMGGIIFAAPLILLAYICNKEWFLLSWYTYLLGSLGYLLIGIAWVRIKYPMKLKSIKDRACLYYENPQNSEAAIASWLLL